MKRIFKYSIVAGLLALVGTALAQTATTLPVSPSTTLPPDTAGGSLILDPVAWIGLLGPIVVFVLNTYIKNVPPEYRAALAGVVGAGLDAGVQALTDSKVPPGVITAVSGLGVMIREVFNQNVTKKISTDA